jgi:hypothetical protein
MIDTIVPLPFVDSISVCPSSSFARSLIPVNPNPILARFALIASGSKPSPSPLRRANSSLRSLRLQLPHAKVINDTITYLNFNWSEMF